MTHLLFFITLLTVLLALLPPPQEKSRFRVDVQRAIRELLEDEDTDSDLKITIADKQIDSTPRGDKTHVVVDIEGKKHKITGTYYLSNLLEELSLARDSGMSTLEIDPARIYEPPARRISRMIREQFWNNLTRRIDEQNLTRILADQKTTSTDGSNYLYVAPDDSMAISYFNSVALKDTALRLRVVVLPHQVDGSYVGSLAGKHGLLALALGQDSGGSLSGVPFVVPGGRFNEMYGWDSYFEALGLLQDGRIDLARAMVDNLVYEINHYGKILNANRTYYLTRSQPPFLTSMMRAVYERLPRNAESLKWLEMVLRAAIREYRDVWRGRDRLTETGLSRYFDSGTGPPPEVEPGHFDHVFTRFARMRKMDPGQFERDYRSGKISVPELDRYFKHDRAMRESGHDSSYRLEGVCADLVTVDLNSLLYKIEVDVAEILEKEFGGRLGTERATDWRERAEDRKRRMQSLLWSDQYRMFVDYNFREHRQRPYTSATSLYPLWAGLATPDEAKAMVEKTLPLLEMPGGIVSSTEASRGPVSEEHPPYQWDYPNGWAPHQMLVWSGLDQYGYGKIAQRVAYRWLYTIARNAADYNGTIPEKFDVVRRTHAVFAEYGNVGTKFSYITREGFGWMNASFQVGLTLLSDTLREKLESLVPPEDIFGK